MWDGGGQRAQDGVNSLAGTGEMLDRLVQCSGRIPMISVVLGPVVGVSALAASLSISPSLAKSTGSCFCPLRSKPRKSSAAKWTRQGWEVPTCTPPARALLADRR